MTALIEYSKRYKDVNAFIKGYRECLKGFNVWEAKEGKKDKDVLADIYNENGAVKRYYIWTVEGTKVFCSFLEAFRTFIELNKKGYKPVALSQINKGKEQVLLTNSLSYFQTL